MVVVGERRLELNESHVIIVSTEIVLRVRVMIYPAKRSQGLRRSRSETPLSVQGEEKDTIVRQLSTPRGVKKSLKSLPRGVGKAANSSKHCKTTTDLVPEWLNLYGDDEGPNTERRA